MIIQLKDTLDSVLNHKQMNKLSTDEYNAILPQVVGNIQTTLFAQFRKLNFRKMRFQDTPNYGDEALYLKQAIEYFITESSVNLDTKGKVELTEALEDFMLINSVFTEKTQCEKTDLAVFNKLTRIPKTIPTNCMPIYTLNGNVMKVFPMTDEVDVTYYRKAKTPKLTSRIMGEVEIFDDSNQDFQDIDLHPIMLQAVFTELLAYFGINLQDQFALQMSERLKQEEYAKQQ